ncbi:MAG: ribosome silencing factor [Candidatus Omnitrophica bacterium]|nr:ribosome silencing factor [Candidatus Omnitrophota bacterium]
MGQKRSIAIDSKRKALIMAEAASDKKGIDIITIKMRKVSGICDYFVIATGTSTTHVRAISDNIIKQLREKGAKLRHIEGEREASWILADFGDVVGHIFLKDTRKFYDLEKLWAKAPQTRFEEPEPSKRKPLKKVVKKAVKKPVRKAAKKPRKKARKKNKK